MRSLIFILIILAPLYCSSQTNCDDGDKKLLYNYWNAREALKDHFVIHDLDSETGELIGDGIGEWDEERFLYTKAGYGILASTLEMRREAFAILNGGCSNSATPDVGNSTNGNVLDYSDATYILGRYFAILASEYQLLDVNGQHAEKQKTLNELFLALQAYRRLDLTANRLFRKSLDCAEDEGIVSSCDWRPNLSGYSGFFLRDDVPADFFDNFPDSDDGVGVEWLVGGILSDFACHTGLETANFDTHPCNFGGAAKYELDENGIPVIPLQMISPSYDSQGTVVSQDQIIGLLFGLAFVKKIIPAAATVRINEGREIEVLDIAQNIAYGLASRLVNVNPHNIYYPPCNVADEKGRKIELGGTSYPLFWGIVETANYIIGPERWLDSSDGLPFNENKIAFDIVASQNLNGFSSAQHFNRRMTLDLIAAGDLNFSRPAVYTAIGHNNFHLLMQLFAWEAVHDDGILPNSLEYYNHNSLVLSANPVDFMKDILCQYTCLGSCRITDGWIEDNPNRDFPCDSQTNGPWDCGALWHSSPDTTDDCDTANERGADRRNSWDYMIAYNLLHLAGGTSYDGYYNHNAFETSDDLTDADLNFTGSRLLCEGVDEIYQLLEGTPGSGLLWNTSENLNIVSQSTDNAEVTVTSREGATGLGWIELEQIDTETANPDCTKSLRQKHFVWIGAPEFDFFVRQGGCEGAEVGIVFDQDKINPNIAADEVFAQWTIQGTNPLVPIGSDIASNSLSASVYRSDIFAPRDQEVSIYLNVEIFNECGSITNTDWVNLPACIDDGGQGPNDDPIPIVAPNPTSGNICISVKDIAIGSLSEEGQVNFSESVPILDLDPNYSVIQLIILRNSEIVKSIQTSQTIVCDDISDLSNGVYNLVAFKGDRAYSSTIVLQK